MFSKCPYVMRDQVKDLVPHLMDIDSKGAPQETQTSFRELAFFAAAIGAYLVILGISG